MTEKGEWPQCSSKRARNYSSLVFSLTPEPFGMSGNRRRGGVRDGEKVNRGSFWAQWFWGRAPREGRFLQCCGWTWGLCRRCTAAGGDAADWWKEERKTLNWLELNIQTAPEACVPFLRWWEESVWIRQASHSDPWCTQQRLWLILYLQGRPHVFKKKLILFSLYFGFKKWGISDSI